MSKKDSRRKLLKSIAAGTGAIVAGKSLPENWSRPVVDSVMLPAHAQTSPGRQFTNINIVQLDQPTGFAGLVDSLVPEAKAQRGPTELTCLTIIGDGTVATVSALITNANGSAQVSATNVPIGGAAVSMAINECPIASTIGQITVQVNTVTGTSATGTYNIGNGQNIVPFTVIPGACGTPPCPFIPE